MRKPAHDASVKEAEERATSLSKAAYASSAGAIDAATHRAASIAHSLAFQAKREAVLLSHPDWQRPRFMGGGEQYHQDQLVTQAATHMAESVWHGVEAQRLGSGPDPDVFDKHVALLTQWRDTVAETRKEIGPGHFPFDIPALATIQEANGRVVGPLNVHGSGGVLRFTDLTTMLLAIENAGRGKALGIAGGGTPGEKRSGHAWMYRLRAEGNENETAVDLRGASVVAWDRAPTCWAREMGLAWAQPERVDVERVTEKVYAPANDVAPAPVEPAPKVKKRNAETSRNAGQLDLFALFEKAG